jgi:LuxR family maltose regulon positive regulatory protein
LSLDETDNDLRVFLTYFVAAVQRLFPTACQKTKILLRTAEIPPLPVLAGGLTNELDAVTESFILVLEDYHEIHESSVHELLRELLRHPPRTMHLVLTSRRDPPLPIATLRARDQVTEVRAHELRFSQEEIESFLEKALEHPVDKATAEVLEGKTEGWAAGLRLAAVSLRQHGNPKQFLSRLQADTHHVMDYLLTEVLTKQPPSIQECLLSTAILDRFCGPLCEVIYAADEEPGKPTLNGESLIDWVERTQLFVIPLDDEGYWFRFHHLFRQLLERRLKNRWSPDEIAHLHSRASAWYAENGLVEAAIHHALEGGDPDTAARLVAEHRHTLMNEEQWHRLESLLLMLPEERVHGNIELLVQKAWCLENRYRLSEMADVVDQIDNFISSRHPPKLKESVRGEIFALAAARSYLASDGKRALSYAEKALDRIPMEHSSQRGYALIVLAFAFQMTGKVEDALDLLQASLRSVASDASTLDARILLALCFIYWMEADLHNLGPCAEQYLAVGRKADLTETTSFAHYFLGIGSYHLNDLEAAERHLSSLIETDPYVNLHNYAQGGFALALTCQAKGDHETAFEWAKSIVSRAYETGNAALLRLAQAFQAELALRQGRLAEAAQWATTFKPEPLGPMYRFFVPEITLAKVFVAQDTTESRGRASDLLQRLRDFLNSIHNKRFLIEVLGIEALLHDARGDETAALSALECAVTAAQPRGFTRMFLDLGPGMARLLRRLIRQNLATNYAGPILSAFRDFDEESIAPIPEGYVDQPISPEDRALMQPLSKREVEVLVLLAKRLSNKEIGEKLFVAPETVKRHTINIYKKLNVNKRREAVTKAAALGIIHL